MFSSYRPEDVTILLKDITGMITPLGTEERERRIQSGTHYSEMLPIEYRKDSRLQMPDQENMECRAVLREDCCWNW